MANYTLSPAPLAAFYDVDGSTPLANGRVFTYTAGTTTPATTYRTSSGTPNLNPIQLDGAGTASIYLAPGSYFYVWYRAPTMPGDDTSGGLVGSQDNISATIASGGDTDMEELAGETILAGQPAYLSDGSGGKNAGQLYLTSSANDYSSTLPLVGMCPNTISAGAIGTFRISGQITGLTTINGADYYVGPVGTLVTAIGSASGKRWVGRADSTSSIIISPNPPGPPLDILQIEALS